MCKLELLEEFLHDGNLVLTVGGSTIDDVKEDACSLQFL
jgi:hypothetical protein